MNSNVTSPPASQSRNPSFLPRTDPAESRRLLWARRSGLRSSCWVPSPSPAGLARLWGYSRSHTLRRSLGPCRQRTWRWWRGDSWGEDRANHNKSWDSDWTLAICEHTTDCLVCYWSVSYCVIAGIWSMSAVMTSTKEATLPLKTQI